MKNEAPIEENEEWRSCYGMSDSLGYIFPQKGCRINKIYLSNLVNRENKLIQYQALNRFLPYTFH